jgi:hypothetical protein
LPVTLLLSKMGILMVVKLPRRLLMDLRISTVFQKTVNIVMAGKMGSIYVLVNSIRPVGLNFLPISVYGSVMS